MKTLVIMLLLTAGLTACTNKNEVVCQAVKIDCKIGAPCPPEIYRDVKTGGFVSREKCDNVLPAQ